MGETLGDAIERDDLAQARRLLLAGVDPDAAITADYTPLSYCATTGRIEFARLLLEFGANPARRDREGRTAADYAKARGYVELAEVLARAELGSRPSGRDATSDEVRMLGSIWGSGIAQEVARRLREQAGTGDESAKPEQGAAVPEAPPPRASPAAAAPTKEI